MLSFLEKTPFEMQEALKTKFRTKRKALKLTQKQLSIKSDVSLGSIKRFESSGQISLESLLKLALVLECLNDFEGVCCEVEEMPKSIGEIINENK